VAHIGESELVALVIAWCLFWPLVGCFWLYLQWGKQRSRKRRHGGYILPSQLAYGSGSLATDGLARTSTAFRIPAEATPGLTALAERLKTGSPTGSGSDTASNPGAPTTVAKRAAKIVQLVPENIYPHPWDGEHERPGAA